MADPQRLIVLWDEVKALVETCEVDMFKSTRADVVSAGPRLRRDFRTLVKVIKDCVRVSTALDKERAAERAAVRNAKKAEVPQTE